MTAHAPRCIVTVATASHLFWAASWAAHARQHNPGDDVRVFVLDASRASLSRSGLTEASGIAYHSGDEIRDPAFAGLRHYYNGLELCCASKTFVIEHAMSHMGYRDVIFLDSDICVYGPLTRAWSALESKPVALTPHVSSPFPDDGASTNAHEMIMHGFINAGFWAARDDARTHTLLAWMKHRMVHDAFAMPSLAISCDQNWLSCTPWFFPETVGVLRDAGMNVAYWNLHERQLSEAQGRIMVNGEPLVFVHYSGFDYRQPDRLTRYAVRAAPPASMALLQPLMQAYAAELCRNQDTLPRLLADLPCCTGHLMARLGRYRKQLGQAHHRAVPALLGALCERVAAVCWKWSKA